MLAAEGTIADSSASDQPKLANGVREPEIEPQPQALTNFDDTQIAASTGFTIRAYTCLRVHLVSHLIFACSDDAEFGTPT